MTTSHWQRPHTFRFPDTSSDVAIIGGGFLGLSLAFWLTEHQPDLKISVLERNQCGAGASGRNAGFLTKGSASFYKGLCLKWGGERAKSLSLFAQESLDEVYHLILKSSPELKSDKTSSLTLFETEGEFKNWKTPHFNPQDFSFEWKDATSIPKILSDKFYGGFESQNEYKVNPQHLLESLKKRLESRRVQFLEHSSAYVLTESGVQTELNLHKTKRVILAMNGYSGEFHSAFSQAIIPKRAQMLAIELEEDILAPSLYYDPSERVYWRKTDAKSMVIGGKRLLDEEGETGSFEKISPLIQQGLEEYVSKKLGLKYKIVHRWSGTMGFTEHELPLVGKVSAPIEAYVIAGFSGHGMGLGFRSARDLVEVMTKNKSNSFFDQFKKADFIL